MDPALVGRERYAGQAQPQAQGYPNPTVPMPPAPQAQYSNMAPLGFQAIYSACRKLYPDQPNPLQVTAVVKYW